MFSGSAEFQRRLLPKRKPFKNTTSFFFFLGGGGVGGGELFFFFFFFGSGLRFQAEALEEGLGLRNHRRLVGLEEA